MRLNWARIIVVKNESTKINMFGFEKICAGGQVPRNAFGEV